MSYRLCLVLCVAAILGCAETETSTPVENDSQINKNRESLSPVEGSSRVSPPKLSEAEAVDTSTTPGAVDQAENPSVGDGPLRTESAVVVSGESEIPKSGSPQTQSAFSRLMTRVHQAIDQERWEEAGHLLDETLQLDPKSVAAQDLRQLVTKQLDRLHQQDSLQKFGKTMHAEDWAEAHKIAARLKTQDPAVLEQIKRAETLIEAEQLLDRLVANPERLSRPSIQTQVSRLRNLIENVDLGSRVGEKFERLNELSQRWTSPVMVNLTSDGYTNVILRPGRNLGRFRTQTVQLMPGEYELIGRRDGFREIRRSLRLNPNGDPKTVEIKAIERF